MVLAYETNTGSIVGSLPWMKVIQATQWITVRDLVVSFQWGNRRQLVVRDDRLSIPLAIGSAFHEILPSRRVRALRSTLGKSSCRSCAWASFLRLCFHRLCSSSFELARFKVDRDTIGLLTRCAARKRPKEHRIVLNTIRISFTREDCHPWFREHRAPIHVFTLPSRGYYATT